MSSSSDSEKLAAGEKVESTRIVFSIQQLLEIGERLGYRSCRKDANWRRNKQQQEKQKTQGGGFNRSEPGKFCRRYFQKQKLGGNLNTFQSSSWKGGSVAAHGKSLSPSSPTDDDLWDMPKEGDGGLFNFANSTLEYERKKHCRKHNIVSPPSPPSSVPLCHPDSPSIPSDALKSTPPPSSVQYPGHSVSVPIPTSNGDDGQAGSFSENSNSYINDVFASLWVSKAPWVPDRGAEPPRASRLSQRSERSDSMMLPSGGTDSEEFYSSMHSHARPTHVTASGLESRIDLTENLQLKHSSPAHGSNSVVPLLPGLTSNNLLSADNCMNLDEFRGVAFEKALTHNVLGLEGGIRDGEVAALQQQSGSCNMNGYNVVVSPPGLIIPKQRKPSQELDLSPIILNDIAPVQTIVSRRMNHHQVPVQSSVPQQELNSVEKTNLSSSTPPRNVLSELQQPSTTQLQPLSSASSSTPKQRHKLQEKPLPSKALDIVKTLGLSPPPVLETSAKESDGRMLERKSSTTEGDRGSQKFAFHTHQRAPRRKTNLSSSLKSLPGGHHLQRVIAQKSSGGAKPLQQYTNNISSVPHQLLKKMLEDKQTDGRKGVTVT